MNCSWGKPANSLSYRIISAVTACAFFLSTAFPVNLAYAQAWPAVGVILPPAGVMVNPTQAFVPIIVKGLTVFPENPLEFDFIIDTGHSKIDEAALKEETTKLIKYFLATLTIPEDDVWVNLSPYEKDRIIPEKFGLTDMGKDLLAQDYLLKQLTASLMYPEDELGKKFWDRVYKQVRATYGTTEIPLNTFNKVWIVPEKAVIYEHENNAFIVESHLKVMLEEDYLALTQNIGNEELAMDRLSHDQTEEASKITSAIVKEILIPEIEKEVNAGKTFANLRQIYHSMILATWYKEKLKNSLLAQVYADKSKIKGIDVEDPNIKQKIYNQYLDAFKKGVYDYIKEDYDPATQEIIPRKYFSGGFTTKTSEGNTLGRLIIAAIVSVSTFLSPSQHAATEPVGQNVTAHWAAVETGENASVDTPQALALVTEAYSAREASVSASADPARPLGEASTSAEADDRAALGITREEQLLIMAMVVVMKDDSRIPQMANLLQAPLASFSGDISYEIVAQYLDFRKDLERFRRVRTRLASAVGDPKVRQKYFGHASTSPVMTTLAGKEAELKQKAKEATNPDILSELEEREFKKNEDLWIIVELKSGEFKINLEWRPGSDALKLSGPMTKRQALLEARKIAQRYPQQVEVPAPRPVVTEDKEPEAVKAPSLSDVLQEMRQAIGDARRFRQFNSEDEKAADGFLAKIEKDSKIQAMVLEARARNILLLATNPDVDASRIEGVMKAIRAIPGDLLKKAGIPVPFDMAKSRRLGGADGQMIIAETNAGGKIAMTQMEGRGSQEVAATIIHEIIGHKLSTVWGDNGRLIVSPETWRRITQVLGMRLPDHLNDADEKAFIEYLRNLRNPGMRRLTEAVAHAAENNSNPRFIDQYQLTPDHIFKVRAILRESLFLNAQPIDVAGNIYQGFEFNGHRWIAYYLQKEGTRWIETSRPANFPRGEFDPAAIGYVPQRDDFLIHAQWGLVQVTRPPDMTMREPQITVRQIGSPGSRGFATKAIDSRTTFSIPLLGEGDNRFAQEGTREAFEISKERAEEKYEPGLVPFIFGYNLFNQRVLEQGPTAETYQAIFLETLQELNLDVKKYNSFRKANTPSEKIAGLLHNIGFKGWSSSPLDLSREDTIRVATVVLWKVYQRTHEDLIKVGVLASFARQGSTGVHPNSWIPFVHAPEDWVATQAVPADIDRYYRGLLWRQGLKTILDDAQKREYDAIELEIYRAAAPYYPSDHYLHESDSFTKDIDAFDKSPSAEAARALVAKYRGAISSALDDDLLASIDVIVPIPRIDVKEYGVTYLADALGELFGKQVSVEALVRTDGTRPQIMLDTMDRLRNVAGSFQAGLRRLRTKVAGESVKGKSILLIDDNETTGATLKEARRMLLEAGAKNVVTFAFGKTTADRDRAMAGLEDVAGDPAAVGEKEAIPLDSRILITHLIKKPEGLEEEVREVTGLEVGSSIYRAGRLPTDLKNFTLDAFKTFLEGAGRGMLPEIAVIQIDLADGARVKIEPKAGGDQKGEWREWIEVEITPGNLSTESVEHLREAVFNFMGWEIERVTNPAKIARLKEHVAVLRGQIEETIDFIKQNSGDEYSHFVDGQDLRTQLAEKLTELVRGVKEKTPNPYGENTLVDRLNGTLRIGFLTTKEGVQIGNQYDLPNKVGFPAYNLEHNAISKDRIGGTISSIEGTLQTTLEFLIRLENANVVRVIALYGDSQVIDPRPGADPAAVGTVIIEAPLFSDIFSGRIKDPGQQEVLKAQIAAVTGSAVTDIQFRTDAFFDRLFSPEVLTRIGNVMELKVQSAFLALENGIKVETQGVDGTLRIVLDLPADIADEDAVRNRLQAALFEFFATSPKGRAVVRNPAVVDEIKKSAGEVKLILADIKGMLQALDRETLMSSLSDPVEDSALGRIVARAEELDKKIKDYNVLPLSSPTRWLSRAISRGEIESSTGESFGSGKIDIRNGLTTPLIGFWYMVQDGGMAGTEGADFFGNLKMMNFIDAVLALCERLEKANHVHVVIHKDGVQALDPRSEEELAEDHLPGDPAAVGALSSLGLTTVSSEQNAKFRSDVIYPTLNRTIKGQQDQWINQLIQLKGVTHGYGLLTVILDGNGGHEVAEFARQKVPEIFQRFLKETNGNVREAQRRTIEELHRLLREDGSIKDSAKEQGSTIAMAYLSYDNARIYTATLGDSWIVIGNSTAKKWESRPHDRRTEITIEGEEAVLAMNGVLGYTQVQNLEREPYLDDQPLEEGDFMLVFSDGLVDAPDRRIEDLLEENVALVQGDSQIGAQNLIGAALERGTRDNVTAILHRQISAAQKPSKAQRITAKNAAQAIALLQSLDSYMLQSLMRKKFLTLTEPEGKISQKLMIEPEDGLEVRYGNVRDEVTIFSKPLGRNKVTVKYDEGYGLWLEDSSTLILQVPGREGGMFRLRQTSADPQKPQFEITRLGGMPLELPDAAAVGSDLVTETQEQKVGGINLNAELLDLQIKRDGNGVPLPLPQQPIQTMQIEGFIPVIINITPTTNLPFILGFAPREQLPDPQNPSSSPAPSLTAARKES